MAQMMQPTQRPLQVMLLLRFLGFHQQPQRMHRHERLLLRLACLLLVSVAQPADNASLTRDVVLKLHLHLLGERPARLQHHRVSQITG